MSPSDAEGSAEDFGATPSSSSAEDGDESDNGAQFMPAAETWTAEERNVLLLRVDDWKASKSVKSQQLIVQGALTDLCSLSNAPPVDGLKIRIKAWYRQHARKPPKAAIGELPTRRKVITHVYGNEIEAAITQQNPDLERGDRAWMAEYSRQFGKFNKRIKSDPKENARIEKLRQQWMNSGPPVAVRRKDAGKTLNKRMNEFAQTMYLELGVRMVVLGAWVNPEGDKKWSVFESNNCLGNAKPNFIAHEPRWHEKPIEKTFHSYVEDYLTGDEEQNTVTRPVGSIKPKQHLQTGEKGQPLLPDNCVIRHGDRAQFLNYQKQVLRSYIERIYNLGAKRTSGHVPWLDIYTRQSEVINQLEYMPTSKPADRSSSMAPGMSRASTVVPVESSEDDREGDDVFTLLRDPSKMQKHEIEACFNHWMARQEDGKIGFEFSNVFNSRDGTLRPAVRLQELSDIGTTDSETPPPPPRNKQKSKQGRKNTQRGQRKVPAKKPVKQNQPAMSSLLDGEPGVDNLQSGAGLLPPHLPDGLLPLGWDPVVDPVLQNVRIGPGPDVFPAHVDLPGMMGPTGDPTGVHGTNHAYAGYLAEMERGSAVMQNVLPSWVQHASIQPSPDPPLRPALRQDSIPRPALQPDHGLGETNVDASRDSPVPDYTRRWMRTRSRSRPPNTEAGSGVDTNMAMSPPAIDEGVKRKRATSKSRTTEPKKPKSTDRPKPRRKVAASSSINPNMDTFDLRHRHAM